MKILKPIKKVPEPERPRAALHGRYTRCIDQASYLKSGESLPIEFDTKAEANSAFTVFKNRIAKGYGGKVKSVSRRKNTIYLTV